MTSLSKHYLDHAQGLSYHLSSVVPAVVNKYILNFSMIIFISKITFNEWVAKNNK